MQVNTNLEQETKKGKMQVFKENIEINPYIIT